MIVLLSIESDLSLKGGGEGGNVNENSNVTSMSPPRHLHATSMSQTHFGDEELGWRGTLNGSSH